MQRHQHRHGNGASCRLNTLRPGDRACIRRHHAEGAIRQRLLDLGFVPLTYINVVRRAPLGDPIECEVDNLKIALRLAEAALIDVER